MIVNCYYEACVCGGGGGGGGLNENSKKKYIFFFEIGIFFLRLGFFFSNWEKNHLNPIEKRGRNSAPFSAPED